MFMWCSNLPLTITSHARLSRNTGRDQDDFRALQALSETRRSRIVALDGAVGVDVADISGHTYRVSLVSILHGAGKDLTNLGPCGYRRERAARREG